VGSKEKGSFIIESQKHLQEFDDPDLRHFDATILAGQSGRLLAKLRGLEVIQDPRKIEIFAGDVGAYGRPAREALLRVLEKQGVIDVQRDGSKISKIEEKVTTEEEILGLTDEIWDEAGPSDEDQATLEIVKNCSQLPRTKAELQSYLHSVGVQSAALSGMELSTKFGLAKRVDNIEGVNDSVFHTPLFGNYNIRKIVNGIHHLDPSLRPQVDSIVNLVGSKQASPRDALKFPRELIDRMQSLGVLHMTKVETTKGTEKEFAFTPSMWGPFGTDTIRDEQEHVMAMLSCIQNGRLYPTEVDGIRYPIRYPGKYLAALIRRKKIGPSTMIGTDYLILEREGIVELIPSAFKHEQYEMRLVKEDVAVRAKRILELGSDSGLDEPAKMESLYQTGDFRNTAQTRLQTDAKMKKTGERSDYLSQQLMMVLRGEK